jgi:hypothetical protein
MTTRALQAHLAQIARLLRSPDPAAHAEAETRLALLRIGLALHG